MELKSKLWLRSFKKEEMQADQREGGEAEERKRKRDLDQKLSVLFLYESFVLEH